MDKINQIVAELERMGLQIMHFPSKGLLCIELSERLKQSVSLDDLEAATTIRVSK